MADDPSNPWSGSGWNVTQQGAYHQQHGAERAAARARDAGTTVGGKRPTGGGSTPTSTGDAPNKTIILKKITSGWSPILAVVVDGSRRVLRVIGWVGGQGDTPPVGKYLGPSGFVATAAAATDIRGAAGTPGSGGGGASGFFTTANAAEALGGQRVVYASALGSVSHADSGNVAQVGLVVGVTTGAVVMGDDVLIQTAGPMTDPSFAFSPGPVYFDSNGVLTQTLPVAGFIQQVALALSNTEIEIQLNPALVLA